MLSPGMEKRSVLPTVCETLMPVIRCAPQVSNAAVPGSPAVSFAGKASLIHCQMSTETLSAAPVMLGGKPSVMLS